ncbi:MULTISPECIES: long-chain fatty acid--CoA ligase [unclassified Arthrobacter]|uniref:long-chain-fatty-acid--CoA ligase n=1 Tax=unclassified Arthrobacter TaxID=235627 RepID=UPI002104EFEE|nr:MULTISPECIES: long-chain fatty acid--CoA ligase [unclassified Arthrobacter]MCQ1946219.1 long-chain fatty acid--CoA ligase [Arthrobacter sp. zg-Y1116]MCQ1986160.1 long-chain fatty acid--CoA ligase [Arthrobacter sp. zg-Y844]MCQ1994100.1 long-chain fatty acid--CoA ligase [Arthrobacter sp. zg-Y1171]UWX81795.1 long-chain fatty acid--CoA ligase [Arthrobacter sp. zg-Y1171]
MHNLAGILTDTVARFPERTALKLDETVVSYAALDAMSAKVAGFLASRGVEPGDRVALVMPNIPQMAFLYFGALRHGAVVVPMNPLLKAREVAYHLQDSGARIAFAWEGVAGEVSAGAEEAGGVEVVSVDSAAFLQLLAGADSRTEVAEVDDQDTAVILYTSGTTGRPKGAALTHRNLLTNAYVAQSLLNTVETDVHFGGLPFFHVFGQTAALNSSVLSGASISLLPRFDAGKALEIIERDGVTIFEGVPTMYVGMLRHPAVKTTNLSSLRGAITGGSAMPLEILHEFEEVFGIELLEGYGLSETSPIVSFNVPGGDRRPGSIGKTVAGTEVRMLDPDGNDVPVGEVGELSVRGDGVMKGYWKNDDATAAAIPDGWFRTGDLARFDEDGNIYIVDRKKDIILRGGYNVYPREVEEVLYEHPAVAEAAVIGIPDSLHGEEIVAVVGLREEAMPADDAARDELIADIQQFTKDRLAAYKYPRRIELTDALPKGPTGKILKREIKVSAPLAAEAPGV